MTGLFGGAFDPPHNGHVALAETALRRFGLERLLVLVVVAPGHRDVVLPFERRFELARLAFAGLPDTEVVPQEEAYTVDAVRDGRFGDALLLVGADEFAAFSTWKEPDEVLEHVRLAVATRPGHPHERLEQALAAVRRPERVKFFELQALDVSSSDLRARLQRGEPVDALVPEAVVQEIERAGLYR